ncbi:hypothetical protein BsWGS_15348 [Bradybaena similaris]
MMDPFESRQGTHILQSLDGFAFILASDGRFLYISETVSIYLGLSQVEMTGSSIFDYVHHQEHAELIEQLGMSLVPLGRSGSPQDSCSDGGSSPPTPRPGSPSEKGYLMVAGQSKPTQKCFCLRMKSTLTKRGVHVKTSGYRVMHIMGTIRCQSPYTAGRMTSQNNNNNSNTSSDPPPLGFVAMAIALPPPTITEMRLEVDTFITRMTPDFKVVYCEPVISSLVDLTAEDVTGRLLYDICHVADLRMLRRCHLDILNKGQALTEYYRLINRRGGHTWIQTCATTMLSSKNPEDENILAINFVVSSSNYADCAMDLWQLTGDVTSLMSSTSSSPGREEKLAELRSSRTSEETKNRSKTQSRHCSSTDSTPRSPISVQGADSSSKEPTSEASFPNETREHSKEEVELPTTLEGDPRNLYNKNKRRKMDTPRKRRNSSGDCQDVSHVKALNLTTNGCRATIITKSPNMTIQDSGMIIDSRSSIPTKVKAINADSTTSSSPEDLSIKRTNTRSSSHSLTQHTTDVYSSTPLSTSHGSITKPILDTQTVNPASPSSATRNTVQELEAAMHRHLSAASFQQKDKNCKGSTPIDPSNVLRGVSSQGSSKASSSRKLSSTPWHASPREGSTDNLPASTFLRSFYTNRESVIKTNSRYQTAFFNGETPTSLLTPPEPDPIVYRDHSNPFSHTKQDSWGHTYVYEKDSTPEAKDLSNREHYPLISYKDHIPNSYFDHLSSALYKDNFVSHYKELSPYKDIPSFTIPGLTSPSGRISQTYPPFHPQLPIPITPSTTDPCSMTPPSPNSPDIHKHPSIIHHLDSNLYSTELNAIYNPSQKTTAINCGISPSSPFSLTSPSSHRLARHQRGLVHTGIRADESAGGSFYSLSIPTPGSSYLDIRPINAVPTEYDSPNRSALPWY